uniref:Uncharacterized protein n=1 Tax=Globodera rostochiensis TaxID=31243 RepID=A0A914H8U8_GLORO
MSNVMSKAVNWVGNVLYTAAKVVIYVFDAVNSNSTSTRPLPSWQDVVFPPISQVLVENGCPTLIMNMNNCLQTKNTNAIAHTGIMLSNRGLDHITIAFKKAVEENMVCRCCGTQMTYIDDLCHCPRSAERCHCISKCDNRKMKALTSGR